MSGAATDISNRISSLSSSLRQGTSGATGQASSTVSSTLSSVKAGLGQVKGNLDQATAGVSNILGEAFSSINTTTKAAADTVSDTLTSVQAAVQQNLDMANAQLTAVTTQVSTSVGSTTEQILNQLPAPVKDAAVAAGGVLSAAAHQAAEHPQAAAVAATAVAVPTAVNWYKARYGGYAGEIDAEQVAALLAEDSKVFLIDIRSEQQREKEGLPELKLQARLKVAAFPLQQITVPSKLAREVANTDELRLLMNAAYIAGLPQCQGGLTRMVVMDSTSSDKARDLARALVSLGFGLSYIMKDGFNGWAEAELPIVEDAVEYNASAGAVLGDELEVIAEKAGEFVTQVAQPRVGVPLLGGTALGAFAVYNYHYSLQYIGALGVLLTLANKAASYSSPQEALDDVRSTFGGIANKAKLLKLPSIDVPKLPQADGSHSSSGPTAVPAGVPASAAAAVLAGGSDAEEGEAEAADEVLEQQPQR
eukprot:GHRR01009603.1.p1 GENE.GHRR01009603.1~~GHRR01009603.1.p1  ORF type:complete len:478 (+),score=187.31 GHRR01009603.1:557-1990(+)